MTIAPTNITYADKPWLQKYDDELAESLDYPAVPLHQFLIDTAKRAPESEALITSARLPVIGRLASSTTYRELDQSSDALASAFVAQGLQKGDRVAIVMPNSVAFVITFFAVLKAGGVVAATNPTYPEGKMAYQINDSGAKFAVVLTLFYDLVKKVQPQTQIQTVIVANIKEYLPTPAKILFTVAKEKKTGHRLDAVQAGDHWFQDLLKQYAGQKANVDVTPDDLAIFQYTGGTTGISKAAMAQHKALVANMIQTAALLSVFGIPGEKHIYMGVIPFFHVYGLVIVVSLSAYIGAKTVLIPNGRDTDEVVDCINHFKPTLFPGVPALYNIINHHPDVVAGKVDLSSLAFCLSGSAPLPRSVKEHFEEFSGAALREGFGMSEAPTATHTNPINGENRVGSIGLPLPDMEMKIVSLEDGITEVPVGEAGELLMSGPNLMIGYHNKPEETDKALRELDGKKWLYTGDIARMDEDGYFYIVDRKKDMALIGGFNVYPANVENVIKDIDAVNEVGVAAIPHPKKKGQEAIKAWVVKEPDSSLTAEDIIAYCETHLAPYEVPRRIDFIKELPKSTVGKTLRRELVRMETES